MGREILRRGLDGDAIDVPGGYLCNLSPRAFAQVVTRLPRRMRGRDFLNVYGDHHDDATTIDPTTEYPVRGATTHPVAEQARVMRFRNALLGAATAVAIGLDKPPRRMRGDVQEPARRMRAVSDDARATALAIAGRQMYGAHRSYSRNCGLGATETDRIVELVRAKGPTHGLHGAKITGGGSGGTVAVLADASPDGTLTDIAAEAIEYIRAAAGASNGRTPRIIQGTSPGAMAIPPITRAWSP
jgi:L-arabinokinase